MRQITFLVLLLAMCASSVMAVPTVGISGIVSDQFGSAVGIAVSVDSNNTTVSDDSGYYNLELVPGTYNISFSKLPEYESMAVNNVIVNYSTPYFTIVSPTMAKKPTGTITGTVTAPCIPDTDGGCYSGYEAPYNLMTIPYYAGEFVDVVTGEYDDVIMFEYHDYKDFAEVPANSVYTFHRGMIATPLRIYSNSSIAAVHKRSDYHIVINPIQILSQNLHADVVALNTASLNILQNLGNNAVIEDFGYGGRFNV